MTEKKFEFRLCSNGYNYLYKDNELYITEKGDYVLLEQKGDVAELLNELYDENEELKSFNQDLSENLSVCADKRLAQGEHLTKLNNENEELKSKLGYEKRQHRHWKKECLESIKEIAQLKREIVHLKGED